jgi:hypothetical protein
VPRAVHQLRSYGKHSGVVFDIMPAPSPLPIRLGQYASTHIIFTQIDSPVQPISYQMTCIGSWNVEINFDHYAQAVNPFRNLRWWAIRKRQEFIEETNKVSPWASLCAGSSYRQKSSSASHRDTVPSEPDLVSFGDISDNELGNTPPKD